MEIILKILLKNAKIKRGRILSTVGAEAFKKYKQKDSRTAN
jgi:hypothetical protein